MSQTLPIRTINRPGDESPAEPDVVIKPGVLTTEFWTTIGGTVLNVVTILAAIGYLKPQDADTITSSVGAILGAAQVLIINGVLIYQYIKSRTTAKTELLKHAMNLRQEFRIEQMRLNMQLPLVAVESPSQE